jgi:H+-translocating NAD(P) transhydrogenase subunit alpha
MRMGLTFNDLYIFLLAGFLGYQLITRIPALLHTPLMAATNAISGIALVGSIVVAGENYNWITNLLACLAVICSTINVVGGFLITDRILGMFKKGKSKQEKKLS